MDWSFLQGPGTAQAALVGGALGVALVAAFLLLWRVRAPQAEAGSMTRSGVTQRRRPVPHGVVSHVSEESAMASNSFATAINCIDGRAQAPVADWLKINCHVSFVDVATIPGPDREIAGGVSDHARETRRSVEISVNAHASQVVAIAGHYNCAAHDVSDDEHKAQIASAAEVVRGWGLPVRVIGLWVNEWWQIETIVDHPAPVAE